MDTINVFEFSYYFKITLEKNEMTFGWRWRVSKFTDHVFLPCLDPNESFATRNRNPRENYWWGD